jgi:hypothetical protein
VNPRKTQRGSCRATEGLQSGGEAKNRLGSDFRVSEGIAADGGVRRKRRITCIPLACGGEEAGATHVCTCSREEVKCKLQLQAAEYAHALGETF